MKTLIMFFYLIGHINATETKDVLNKIQELAKNLQHELKSGLKESPQKAVKSCQIMAPKIRNNISSDEIEVGRVSTRYRNPNNKPEVWMEETIQKYHQNQINSPYVIVDLDNGKKGLLKPIKIMPLCLNCHGENIKEEISHEIKTNYPQDKAINYKLGQIRGFFWAKYKP